MVYLQVLSLFNLNNNSLLFLQHTLQQVPEGHLSQMYNRKATVHLNCPNIEKHAKHEFVCFI